MHRSRLVAAACVLAAGAAACSSTADLLTNALSLQVTAADSAQAVAVPAGQSTAADLDLMNATGTMLGFSIASAPVAPSANRAALAATFAAASGCTLDSTTYVYTCPSATVHGVSRVVTVEFFDSTGAPMLEFNDTTTASAKITSAESGVLTAPHGADTVSHQRTMTVSGLQGHNTTRTWNGSGSGNSSAYWTDSIATRTATVSSASTYTNIVVNLPRSTNPWPASGTISRNVTGTATISRLGVTKSMTVTRTVTITFNGTEFVPLTVGNESFTLDLATGEVTRS